MQRTHFFPRPPRLRRPPVAVRSGSQRPLGGRGGFHRAIGGSEISHFRLASPLPPGRHNAARGFGGNTFPQRDKKFRKEAAASGRDFTTATSFAANLEYFTTAHRQSFGLGGAGDFIRNANLLYDTTGDNKSGSTVFAKQGQPPSAGTRTF